MTITSSDPQHFIPPDTRARSYVEANPSIPAIYLQLGGGADQMVTLVLDWGHNTKAGALAQLAEWVAAVEALPDDTHAGQGVLTCPTCEGSRSVGEPGYTYYGIPDPGSFEACPDCMDAHGIPTGTAPVWRTLTFGDLRAGDVVKLDEDGDEETVRASWPDRVPGYWWYRGSKTCGRPHNTDPVLVRHPRPEVGQ